MITIQTGMLIALGFLAACLLGLLLAPAFWSRAVRLTTRRIKDTIPLSQMEIEADRDRIRAEYAIKMHKLESLVEQVKLAGARQQIEINRRDARVNMLEADLERLRASYEEAQNARRVLEQTITDRLPRVEGRLTEAKRVLFARGRGGNEPTPKAERNVRAPVEASAETDADEGLEVELDRLKAKTREQAQLIERLQRLSRHSIPGLADAASQPLADEATGPDSQLAQAGALVLQAEHETQMLALRDRNDDQAAEIARLKAAIAVFERDLDGAGKIAIRESKVAMKARLQSLEAQATQQAETVLKLRSELALANERLARDAAHHTSELQRLAGGANVVEPSRRSTPAGRSTLADRVAQARTAAAATTVEGPGLAEGSIASTGKSSAKSGGDDMMAGRGADRNSERSGGSTPSADNGLPSHTEVRAALSEEAEKSAPQREGLDAPAVRSRPRLLDRIAGLSRTS